MFVLHPSVYVLLCSVLCAILNQAHITVKFVNLKIGDVNSEIHLFNTLPILHPQRERVIPNLSKLISCKIHSCVDFGPDIIGLIILF